jgi:hypothetical protein
MSAGVKYLLETLQTSGAGSKDKFELEREKDYPDADGRIAHGLVGDDGKTQKARAVCNLTLFLHRLAAVAHCEAF